ncbi:nucleoside deaminase [Candidatus Micrarchaeota archaeon]|nr:nucleoside deaminase [Candidatus Micrarchaeota archaeon]
MNGREPTARGREFMEMAIAKAMEGVRRGDSPFGSCIERAGKAVALAHNTVLEKKDATNHAEMNAIRLACRKLGSYKLDGCTVYSTTEPCPMCFSAIHWAGAKSIVFGTRIADVRRLGFNELTISSRRMKGEGNSEVAVTGGFMRKECLALLDCWKGRKGKRTY